MFVGHGKYHFAIDPPFLYLELFEGFNKEGVIQFRNAMFLEYQKYPENAIHYAIVNLTHWQLGTADSMEQGRKMFENMAMRGYTNVDYLANGNSIATFYLKKLWQDLPVKVNFFDSTEQYLSQYPERRSLIKQFSEN
ncbi:hypothetical protein [Pseudoalteromonas tunicata]|jgi:hypothetical protein|uniref:Uncharacterized protein n=1 Tax=Pseudoalteromonas tunicata D2 TaxID=87626 RepID=A4C5B0_9GAMM|nr:hypothetical protein [Pseudoalteromonas tunicata]ATC96785.1 hypothetical protein PTUN_b0389 [Pseudoalteromonas tunicata]AXT32932.1 hypothetical protein D1819_19025 [Pseudoalteromonas tunicata]EAR30742.1 hypothetical protein PTD2_04196 [Pseudoalteromonas tunicata D2]